MIKLVKFYLEEDLLGDNRWYIDLDDYLGPKADLEMVEGADELLDYLECMSTRRNEVFAVVSDTPLVFSDFILLKADDFGNYKACGFLTLDVWLCEVTKFVFDGNYPEKIYIKQV